jgi:CelD/BcsL family acetyltransferase involved in cellulose biosynthesis
VLYLNLARAAADTGLDHLDLGKGDESYKQRLKTGDLTVGEGALYRPSVAAVLHGVRHVPVRTGWNFVVRHRRIRRLARSTLACVGRMRSAG